MNSINIVKTPINKIKVELKSWITGRQQREIDNVAIASAEISIENNKPNISKIQASVARKIEDKSIEVVVVSVNDSTEKVLDAVLDMHSADYNFILEQVNKVLEVRGLSKEKKS